MRPAKKITIITLKQPQKLPDDFVPRHLGLVTTAIDQIFEIALDVAKPSSTSATDAAASAAVPSIEPTNGIVTAQSARFCRAIVCTDVASSAERLVVNNAGPQLWAMLREASNRHAERFRDAVLPAAGQEGAAAASASSSAASTSTAGEDIDALKSIARMWISWSGAVHFIQHLLSWMEKADSASSSSSAGAAAAQSSIRGTCFGALSSKLVGTGRGVAALNAAVRGFLLCLRAHRDGDDDIPALEMSTLKHVMLQCNSYGDEAVAGRFIVKTGADSHLTGAAAAANSNDDEDDDLETAAAGAPAKSGGGAAAGRAPLLLLAAYLHETRRYYRREARELLLSSSSPSGIGGGVVVGGTGALCELYAGRVHVRLHEERARAQHFLAAFSRPLADAVLQQALVAPPFDEVVQRDFAAAVAKVNATSLSSDAGAGGMLERQSSSASSAAAAAGGALMMVRSSSNGGSGMGMGTRSMSSGSNSGAFLPFASTELAVLHRIYVFANLPYVGGKKVELLREAFRQYVAAEAMMVVNSSSAQPQLEGSMVPQLLQLYAKCEAIVSACFKGDEDLRMRFRDGVQKAMRTRPNKVAELVAKQFDVLLREGDRSSPAAAAADGAGAAPSAAAGGGSGSGLTAAGSSDATLAALERLCRFARLVPAKDIFETFYMQNMSKRLLHFRTTYGGGGGGAGGGGNSGGMTAAAAQNEDLEHTVISRLKHVCGPTIATRCTGMMKDMELSRDFVAAVADKMLQRDPSGLLDPLVLTQGYWPVPPEVHVPLPSEMRRLSRFFTRLYAAEFKRRKLVWSPLLSTAVVRGQFWPKGEKGAAQKKEFVVSFLQSVILTTMSGRGDAVTEQELRNAFVVTPEYEKRARAEDEQDDKDGLMPAASSSGGEGGDEGDGNTAGTAAVPKPGAAAESERALNEALQCAIYSLIAAKLVISTDRKDSVTTITKLFETNRQFTHRQVKIRVAQVQLRAAEESTQTAQSTIAMRAHTVDAAIARIMKSKKRVAHWDLVTQTLELTKLPLDPADIKKRIESLIDKSFMNRDPDDPSTYIFVA